MQYHENPVFQQLIESIEANLSAGFSTEIMEDILQLRDLTTLTDDPTVLAAAHVYCGILEWQDGNRDECIVLCNNALSLGLAYDSPALPYFSLRAYTLLATVYAAEGDCYAALGSCLNAYHISGTHPEYRCESMLLHKIGCLFMDLSQPALALGYLTNAYDCYREQELDDHALLILIVFDVIFAYSHSHDYDQAALWALDKPIDWGADDRVTLDCILLINEAAQFAEDAPRACDALERFLALAGEKAKPSRHLYRCYLYAADRYIFYGEREQADIALASLSSLRDIGLSPLLRYRGDALRVEYYRKFVRTAQIGSEGDSFWEPFFDSSLNLLERLQANYLSSLLLELELDQSKFLNNSVLRRSFHVEKDLELDPLTGLLNHASSEKYILERLSTRETGSSQAVLLLRINDFKRINDAFGHHYGDMLLLQVADILNTSCTSDTLVGRWEGDQFLLFLGHARSAAYVTSYGKELLEAGTRIALPDKAIGGVSFSIGAMLIRNYMPLDDILSGATQALSDALTERFVLTE